MIYKVYPTQNIRNIRIEYGGYVYKYIYMRVYKYQL